MTFLKQLPPGSRQKVIELINQDLECWQKMMEITERMQKNIKHNLNFYRDVLRNRQSLENLVKRAEANRRSMQHD
jgi:hypothetical protein